MSVRSQPCRGFTAAGAPCANKTRSRDGWCGRCAGTRWAPSLTDPPPAAAEVATDPLAGDLTGDAPVVAELKDPNCPPATVAAIAERAFTEHGWSRDAVVAAALRHPNCPARLLRKALAGDAIGRLRRGERPPLRRAALENPNCPPLSLARAAFQRPRHGFEHRLIAENPNTPGWVLSRLARQSTRWRDPGSLTYSLLGAGTGGLHPTAQGPVRCAVAANPATPPRVLARLAVFVEPQTRASVAANPRVPPVVLRDLSLDSEPDVRAAAASNPNCGPELVAGLAVDAYPEVRAAVAARPGASPDTLTRLAGDPDPAVRAAAAANPACPPAARSAAGLLAD